jgi:hypothetical protein
MVCARDLVQIFMGAHIVHALTTTVLAGKTYNDRLRSILNEVPSLSLSLPSPGCVVPCVFLC